jgi:3-hydroxybutyryl-CoA dehydratase
MDNTIEVGDTFTYSFKFTQEDVVKFSEASGDFNPIHLDSSYAKNTIFGRTIIHGFLGGSVFSKVFGTIFPGEGTIYLKQDLSFFKPMFTLENYIAKFEIIDVVASKNRALVTTIILDNTDEIVIKGEALIKHSRVQ